MRRYAAILLLGVMMLASTPRVHADIFAASDFQVLDPVIGFPGERLTSADFILIGGMLSQPAIGTSTAADFDTSSGFLYFPTVDIPTVTATAGNQQVALSWTAATGFLGWTVSGYRIGQSITSDGPYSYSSVAAITSTTVTGLTNGTAYYFVVSPEDFFGNAIATSTEVSATPESGEAPQPTPEAGGGGGFIAPPIKIPPSPPPPPLCPPGTSRSDLNCDGHVDLQDFSIFLFYQKRPLVPANPADINEDMRVDVRDLSVLFFQWTSKLIGFASEESVPAPTPFTPVRPRDSLALVAPPAQQEPESEIITPIDRSFPELPPPSPDTWAERIIRAVVGVVRGVVNLISGLFGR